MEPIQDPNAEIRRLRQELSHVAAARDEAERAKNEYMQNVAHQLAAPINAIKMNIESLKNPKIQFDRKMVLLSSIYSQGTILAHLIKNFSLMSHLEADHNLDSFREKPEDVDLYRLCVNFSNDFQPIGAQKDQSIEVLEDQFRTHKMPKASLIKNLFSQVIYNLLENATKYGDPDTKITIGLRVEPSFLAVTVTSVGAPLSQAEAPSLFDRGVRGTSAKALHPAGTGFGLYIARRIMEIHKGQIAVDIAGKRTTFIVKCPKGRS